MVQDRRNNRKIGAVDRQPGGGCPSEIVNPEIMQADPAPNLAPGMFDAGDSPLPGLLLVLIVWFGRK